MTNSFTAYGYIRLYVKEVIKNINSLRKTFKVSFSKKALQSDVLSRKIKMALATITITFLFVVARLKIPVSFENIFFWGFVYLALGILTFFISLWLFKPVTKHTVWSIIFFPAIFVFLGTFTIHDIFLFELARISYVFVFMVLVLWFLASLWIFILMTNILNVNMQQYVPISRLAEGVLRLYVLTAHVLVAFIIYILISGQYLLYSFNYLWVIMGMLLLFLIWYGVYRYFSRDFSKHGMGFAMVAIILIALIGLLLTILIQNLILVLIILLYFVLKFYEYFVYDMKNVN